MQVHDGGHGGHGFSSLVHGSAEVSCELWWDMDCNDALKIPLCCMYCTLNNCNLLLEVLH